MRLARFLLPTLLLLASGSAQAVTLTLRSETTPWPGVTVRNYRTGSPSADAWVAIVDLCASNIHVDATRPIATSFKSTGSWARANGAAIATNGDFYASPPLRVRGNAVGEGIPWPIANTGLDPQYASEYSYRRYGWIAFTHDGVVFNHTKWAKQNSGGRSLGGWSPTAYTDTLPPGILSLVSGFPEIVTEGAQVTCSSPTNSSCFPDRSDMRARHPRTAMGITQDLRKFILLVVDGRTSTSAGMYGAELAETMKKLGAWQAFNLDGGGSSQFWQKDVGYRNNIDGNNLGNGTRAVLNHWGVWAGRANGKPSRPGHCVSSAPCELIPAAGGTIDNTSACFRTFGPASYWHKETTGSGGSLVWTYPSEKAVPTNWAWWRLELEQAGEYRVEYYANRTHGTFTKARYSVLADGTEHAVTVNQSRGSGWTTLGTWRFAAGGNQYVRVNDNAPPPVDTSKRIVADAIRLVPVTPTTGCGNGTCEATEDCNGCPSDCGACPRCGDGSCNGTEDCSSCARDCGTCCGNGVCDPSESCNSCPSECGSCVRCGDGTCNGAEDCNSCPSDCGRCCGNGTCDEGETCGSCASDCGACVRCGDGTCSGDETCSTCPSDCGACVRCGDGACTGDETCSACPADCGSCCGNRTCDEGESCSTCPGDCGGCSSCGNGACDEGESCSTCPGDCGACSNCGNGLCNADESCSTCPGDCGDCGGSGTCGDDVCTGGETCGDCPADCGNCAAPDGCGDGTCGSLESCDLCPEDCGPCEAPDAGSTPPGEIPAGFGGCACSSGEPFAGGLVMLLALTRTRRRNRAISG